MEFRLPPSAWPVTSSGEEIRLWSSCVRFLRCIRWVCLLCVSCGLQGFTKDLGADLVKGMKLTGAKSARGLYRHFGCASRHGRHRFAERVCIEPRPARGAQLTGLR